MYLFLTVLYLLNFEFTTITLKRKLLFTVFSHSLFLGRDAVLPHRHRTVRPRLRRPTEHAVLIPPDNLSTAKGQGTLQNFHLMSAALQFFHDLRRKCFLHLDLLSADPLPSEHI